MKIKSIEILHPSYIVDPFLKCPKIQIHFGKSAQKFSQYFLFALSLVQLGIGFGILRGSCEKLLIIKNKIDAIIICL